MGTLKPGASYIYERVGGTVYSREAGSNPSTRTVAGYSLESNNDPYYKNIANDYLLEIEWKDIIRSSKDNPTLQAAIDRVKILYHLSKKDEQK
jgi:hypothetical protein